MQTMTSQSNSRRRWARFIATSATALLAATAVASAAGAASTPSSSFNGASGSVAALSGSSMEVQNPSVGTDDGQLDVDDAVLQDGDRDGEHTGGWRLRHRDRDAVQVVQDDHRRPQHHGRDPFVHGVLHRLVPYRERRHLGRWSVRGSRRLPVPLAVARGHQRDAPLLPRRRGPAVRRLRVDHHRVGQGDRGQRLDGLGLRRRHLARQLLEDLEAELQEQQEQEAGHTQDARTSR